MPYTETQKVRKATLRLDGVNTPEVWDRESAGYEVKRDVIG